MKNRISTKAGAYSITLTCIVLAILVAVNVFMSVLPASATQLDMSASKLYSITSNTKVVVNDLNQDVTIYWIVQSGEEDAVIENLLSKYESISDNITVIKKNPDVYPTFAAQYTSDTVANNSLVVESGNKNRYIAYDDIYVTAENYYSYTYDTSFDGEGAITSSINYVTSDDLPKMYLLEGHGEGTPSGSFAEQLEKENVQTDTFSLLNTDAVPEDADCVMIYAPTSDISKKEAEILSTYIEDGGKVMVAAGTSENGELTNLCSIMEGYGLTAEEGIVVEGNTSYYAFQSPLLLLPQIYSDEITDSLLDENYYVIMPAAQGWSIENDENSETDGENNGVTITELLSTSTQSYAKSAGYEMSTYEEEDGDAKGPFSIGLSIENEAGGRLVWFASSLFLEDTYNSYSSGANVEIAMNALSSMMDKTEAMSIRSKSLSYNYLTISESQASTLETFLIGIIPAAYLAVGIVIVMRRRKMYGKN